MKFDEEFLKGMHVAMPKVIFDKFRKETIKRETLLFLNQFWKVKS